MIQIHDHGKIIEVEPSDKSQLTRGIMRSSELLLSFRSDVALDIHVGATVDFEGETFTLIYPSELRKLRRGYYDYTVTMHSSAELLKQRLLKDPSDPGRTAFTFTGSAHDFATLVARSMGKGWSVGDCMVSDGDRMIAFREETCLGALARIAEDFHSEWVVERQTIAIRKQELWRDAPVAMSYGRGKGFLSGVSRSGDGDKLPISRLYVVGGSRNIDPAAYGSRSLHLPDGSTALSSGVEGREAALDLSHIYPSRVGTVSEVVTVDEAKCFYDIKDDSIPAELNYSDCRIPGEKAVIRFQSGALAGRELEIRQSETALEGYHHEERRFELVPREEDGFTFPSPQWMPKAGDRYAVFGISLPPTYIKEAEERMLSEAKRYLEDNKEPVYTFRGEVDGIWARKHWLEVGGKLVPGGHVLFSDPEFHPSGSVIRIVSTTQAVNDPHAPSVTLSTAPVPGSFLSRLDKVEADEVVRREQIREVQRQQSQSYRQALEHLSMVDRAVEGLEGFTRRIKPSVLETMGILVGSQATQLDFVRAVGSLESVTPAFNYDPSTKALHVGESVLRHQTIGITTMRDRRDPSEYRYWRLPDYVSPPLTDPDRSYYIYARAARVGSSGSFLLSEKPIPMESEEGWYHLLIGTLSSLDGGDRAYNRLYGFSMISPGQMVVDTISSANGRMSIDLARGEIYASSVSFSRPDGARGSLSDLAGEVDELQSHPPKIVDGKWHVWDGKAQTYVNTGGDARGETGKNGLSPKIVDGKWSVWDGSRWVSTGVPAQGPKGEQGDKGEKGEQGAPGKDGAPGLQGLQGKQGEQGLPGKPGKDGKDGLTAYTHIAYADTAQGGGFSQSPAGKAYVGMYVDHTAADSPSPSAYAWSLFKGADGRDGTPGKPGADGKTPYLHIAYCKRPTDLILLDRLPNRRIDDEGKVIYDIYADLLYMVPVQAGEILKLDNTVKGEWYRIVFHDPDGKVARSLRYDPEDKTKNQWTIKQGESFVSFVYTRSRVTHPTLSGALGFSVTDSSERSYIGQYTDYTQLDSSDPSRYTWSRIKGDKGAKGDKGENGRTIGRNLLHPAGYNHNCFEESTNRSVRKCQRGQLLWLQKSKSTEPYTLYLHEPLSAGTYTLSYKCSVGDHYRDYIYYPRADGGDGWIPTATTTTKKLRDGIWLHSATFYNIEASAFSWLQFYGTDPFSPLKEVKFWEVKLENGAVATDFAFDSEDGRAHEVRPNLWSTKVFSFFQNNNFGVNITSLPGLRYRLDKVAMSPVGETESVSFYTEPTVTRADYMITCKIIESNKPLLYSISNPSMGYSAGDKIGEQYRMFYPSNSRFPGLYWSWQGSKNGAEIGDYAIIGEVKVERIDPKEDIVQTAYLPHPDDLKGDPGKDGAPGRDGRDGKKGDKGDGLDIIDSRNDNQPPSWYRRNHPRTTCKELKYQSKIGVPSGWQSGTYCTLETTVRWADTSGGRVEQSTTLDNGTQLRRVGTADDTAWEPWINITAQVQEVRQGLSSATTLIESLQRAQELKLDRDEMPEIGYLLAALRKPKGTQVAGGLLLSNQIILSDAEDDIISATLSGQRAKGAKSLRLGIDYTDGKDAGTEQTALCNDGTGHLGDLYFGGEEIGFGDKDKRYMQIGGTARSEYDMVNASTVIREFSISGGTMEKSGVLALDMFYSRYSNREIKYTANLSARAEARAYRVPDKSWDPLDNRYHKPEYIKFERIESYATAQLKLELKRGESIIKTVTSPEVSVSAIAQGGQFGINEVPAQDLLYADDRKSQAVTITISPGAVREQDTVTLSLVTTIRRYGDHLGSEGIDGYASATASAGRIINYLPYDTSKPMVSVTKDRAAFFYGRSKYILLNYLRDCVMKVVGNMIIQGNLTVKGDLKTEGGGFLAGGVISTNGSMYRWVGKKLKVLKRSTGRYRITHNIGHTNYCIQAIPVNDTDWNAFVISGTETTYDVEIGVQWNGGWRDGAIHFAIFAQ